MGAPEELPRSDRYLRIHIAGPGDTPERVAREVRGAAWLSADDLNALREGNGLTPNCILNPGDPLCMNISQLLAAERDQWIRGRPTFNRAFGREAATRRLGEEAPCFIEPFGQFANLCETSRYATGPNISRALGFGMSIGSAYALGAQGELGRVAKLADEVYSDVMAAMARHSASPFGASKTQVGTLDRLLRGNAKYRELVARLDKLPAFLRQQLAPLPPAIGASGQWVRRQIIVPRGVQNPAAYVGRFSGKLGGQVLRYARLGGRLTWYIPAVMGVYETAIAPAGHRARTAVGEAVGIAFGASATALAGYAAGAALSMSVGAFVLPGIVVIACVALVGGAAGFVAYEKGKVVGITLYDAFQEYIYQLVHHWVVG